MSIPFRQARFLSRGRLFGTIRQIVIHGAQDRESADSAEGLQWACATWDREASWHYAIDCDTITQSVQDEDRAWAAGPGNDFGLHIELSGKYNQTPEQWADPFSSAMLDLAVPFVASKCREHEVPAVWLTVEEMWNNDRGIVSHYTISLASQLARRRGVHFRPWWTPERGWRKTDHIDPGPHFPHVNFLRRVNEHLSNYSG